MRPCGDFGVWCSVPVARIVKIRMRSLSQMRVVVGMRGHDAAAMRSCGPPPSAIVHSARMIRMILNDPHDIELIDIMRSKINVRVSLSSVCLPLPPTRTYLRRYVRIVALPTVQTAWRRNEFLNLESTNHQG